MNSVANELRERIKREGSITGQVIKVDGFLNHMADPLLMDRLGTELADRFAKQKIDKIITAESSGNMIAQALAVHLGIPFIYAKKKTPPDHGCVLCCLKLLLHKRGINHPLCVT